MLLKSDFANSLGPVVKEHCDQLELQLRRLRQLVAQKDVPKDNILPQVPRMLTRLEALLCYPVNNGKMNLNNSTLVQLTNPKALFSVPLARDKACALLQLRRKLLQMELLTIARLAYRGRL